MAPRYHGDLRITDEASMAAVKAAVGALRMDIEAALSSSLTSTTMGGAHLTVVGGTWVRAQPVGVRNGVDLLLTGAVRKVDIEAIREVLAAERVALLSPIGYSPTGEAFNLRNADVAEAVAIGLRADKLIFVLESDPATWPFAETAGDAGHLLLGQAEEALAAENVLQRLPAEDRNCLRAALSACRGGVKRVHLVGSGTDGSLLRELFSRDGVGVMLHADSDYEATRQATVEDLGGIHALIRPLQDSGVLVPRTREQLELDIGSFWVMLRDGMVIACHSLVPYPDEGVAEFACVAVHPAYRGSHRAQSLLRRAEGVARRQGCTRLFALTTHTSHWFVEHGFVAGTMDDLPVSRRADYNLRRNSHVLVKRL